MVNILHPETDKCKRGIQVKTCSIIAGGCAGVSVAAIYYPMDTLKTRLQSPQGFHKAGGFRGVYKGCLTLLIACGPTNSIFFGSYETSKCYFEPLVSPQYISLVHISCAACCRALTCIFRVPFEVAIQRQQVYMGPKPINAISILLEACRREGVRRGMYRGFASTVMRDIPYTFIELPIWELLKKTTKEYNDGQINVFQSAGCATCASAFAVTMTTPCDVVKTRIILTRLQPGFTYDQIRFKSVLANIYSESGIKGLYAGMTPRIIGVPGARFLFFVVYEKIRRFCEQYM